MEFRELQSDRLDFMDEWVIWVQNDPFSKPPVYLWSVYRDSTVSKKHQQVHPHILGTVVHNILKTTKPADYLRNHMEPVSSWWIDTESIYGAQLCHGCHVKNCKSDSHTVLATRYLELFRYWHVFGKFTVFSRPETSRLSKYICPVLNYVRIPFLAISILCGQVKTSASWNMEVHLQSFDDFSCCGHLSR
jgi:hypothetical protein